MATAFSTVNSDEPVILSDRLPKREWDLVPTTGYRLRRQALSIRACLYNPSKTPQYAPALNSDRSPFLPSLIARRLLRDSDGLLSLGSNRLAQCSARGMLATEMKYSRNMNCMKPISSLVQSPGGIQSVGMVRQFATPS